MLTRIPDAADLTSLEKVVVVYESPAARDSACQQLTHRFSSDQTENFHWCYTGRLHEPECVEALVRRAAGADLIIFAASAEGDFSPEVKSSIERWLARRGDREGALVGLFNGGMRRSVAPLKEIYLRHAAHRAGMDYLSHLSPNAGPTIPDSLDNFSRRAGQMTSVLDQILHTEFLPAPPR
jgi:hypothetical protein